MILNIVKSQVSLFSVRELQISTLMKSIGWTRPTLTTTESSRRAVITAVSRDQFIMAWFSTFKMPWNSIEAVHGGDDADGGGELEGLRRWRCVGW